jgi:ATP-dependent helicase Lhr and Lhr-like helicase
MLPELHRLEARGEIRGGRFVAGFAGEQFALPEAIPMLREVRRRPPDGSLVCISGVDPLNLTGSILPGERVSALVGNKIAFLDGIPVSTLSAGRTHHLATVASADEARVRASLLGRRESLYAGAVPP